MAAKLLRLMAVELALCLVKVRFVTNILQRRSKQLYLLFYLFIRRMSEVQRVVLSFKTPSRIIFCSLGSVLKR